jgi:hypothetical protein
MDKRSKIIIGLFVGVVILIILTEFTKPKPLDWRPSYTSYHKKPFGGHILFQELKSIFPEGAALKNRPTYSVLTELDSTETSNYLIIGGHVDLDRTTIEKLLDYVHRGSSVFIATERLPRYLADTLNLSIQSTSTILEDSVRLSLTHKTFRGQNAFIQRGSSKSHIKSLDSLNSTILGHARFTKDSLETLLDGESEWGQIEVEEVNFIKTKLGKGHFYVHANPIAFTNYYMLYGHSEYVSRCLSYLPEQATYWDDYLKDGRQIIDSPLRYVLNQDALRWAYYLGVVGLLLFMIFRAKREQRIIPIVKPLENSSVAFAKTVGNLYFQHQDYADLIQKKINFFLAEIRANYHVDTQTLDMTLAKQLAAKSGNSLEKTETLFKAIQKTQQKIQLGQADLIRINKLINEYRHP